MKVKKLIPALIACSMAYTTLPGLPVAKMSNMYTYAADATTESSPQQSAQPVDAQIAIPTVSMKTGLYNSPISVTLSTTTEGAEIYYTLDGIAPDETSAKYTPDEEIHIAKSTNISVAAVKNGVWSKPATYGYIIKSMEGLKLSFVGLSDIHISKGDFEDSDRKRFASFFDTISSIMAKPDAIIATGDHVNDDPESHEFVKSVLQTELERKDMTESKIRFAIGNHDVSKTALAVSDYSAMIEAYADTDWYTDKPQGYYNSIIEGYNFLFLDGNNYQNNVNQRNWLKERMDEITSDQKNINKPIFITVHQPIPNTVMDGQQTANPILYEDLKNYPQAIVFSGHSHLNNNDDRSIHQKDFTSIHIPSTSYTQTDRGYHFVSPDGRLIENRATFANSQAQFIWVYEDRIEVERINLNGDPSDTYPASNNNGWFVNVDPPFNSAGSMAGKGWEVRLDGATNDEIKSKFTYTPANRNKVAPQFGADTEINVLNAAEQPPKLSFRQAKDDQFVHHYQIKIENMRTGELVQELKVLADYIFSPVPNTMNIPLAALADPKAFAISITAVDTYGNRSKTIQTTYQRDDLEIPVEEMYTFEQLKQLLQETEEFQKKSQAVVGVSYSQELLAQLQEQVGKAQDLTVDSEIAGVDRTYVDLMWAFKRAMSSVSYQFISREDFQVKSYSSYADNENALPENILDGSTATAWVSKWVEPMAQLPHWFIIDMNKAYEISGIQRSSRQNIGQVEYPKEFTLYAADRLEDLSDTNYLETTENKTSGTFDKTWNGLVHQDFLVLDKPVTGRYVKFEINSTYHSTAQYASMSELNFTGTALKDPEPPYVPPVTTPVQKLPDNAISVPDKALTAEAKQVTIDLKDDKQLVYVSKQQVAQLQERSFIVTNKQLEWEITAQVMRQLAADLPDKATALVFQLDTAATVQNKAQQAVQQLTNEFTHYQTVGNSISLGVMAATADSKDYTALELKQPTKLAFPVPAGFNTELAGIYQLGDNEVEYMGSNIMKDIPAMTIAVDKAGHYAMLTLKKTFADVPSQHWAASTIQQLAAKHIVSGVTESTFAPEQKVTRAEFTTLLARTLGLQTTITVKFSDVSANAWYAKEVAAAQRAGIVTGADNRFEPERFISRQEMAAMLVRAYEYHAAKQLTASDVQLQDATAISSWALPYIQEAIQAGLLQGKGQGFFQPAQATKRTEAAQAVFNLLQKLK